MFGVVPLVYFCRCCLCFWCQTQKVIAKTSVKEITLNVSSCSFMVYGLTFKFLIHFLYSSFLYFCIEPSSFPSTIYWIDCLFPMGHSWLLCHKLTDNTWVWVYFWFLCYALLIYVLVCMPIQYLCRENLMDRGAWQATVHMFAKSWIWVKRLSMYTSFCFD